MSILTRVLPLSSPLFDCQRAARPRLPGPSARAAPRLDRIPRPTPQRQGYPASCVVQSTSEQGRGGGPGTDLLSRAAARRVSSALGRFTTVFGMGTGGAAPPAPPRPPRILDPRLVPRVARVGCADVRRSWRPGVVPERDGDAEPSAISTAPLHASRRFHARPIDQVVYLGPYLVVRVGTLISGRASRLDAFSGYPCRTSATRRCRWRDNRSTGGPSVPVLSY